MTIINKHAAILRQAEVPVVCDTCGYTAEVNKSSDHKTLSALVEASYLHSFKEELSFLNPARKPRRWGFVVEAIKTRERQLDCEQIICPHCQTAHLRIETVFFDELGW